MLLAYGYCRYSSNLQDEKSIEQQKRELKDFADRNDIKIINYYCDEAKSGRKDDRDSFQNMISDCARLKEVQAVLVWKTDRFARNTQDSIFYRNKLKKAGIKLISITQLGANDDSPEGQLMATLLAGMDEYYSQNLASNVRRAQKNKAHKIEFNGGSAPLGFDIVDKHYVINEREANIVKLIFSMYTKGYGLLDIAAKLNEEGYTTKKGNKFGKNSIYEILSNEKYIGTYVFNKGFRHNRHIKRDDTIIYEDVLPQIIDKEVFNMVKEIRKENDIASGKHSAKKIYLLSGLIVCGTCGANYCGRTSSKTKNGVTYKTGYYSCGNRNKLSKCISPNLKQDELEQYIINLLSDKLMNSTNIEEIVEKVNKEYSQLYQDSVNDVAELKERISDLTSQVNNLMQGLAMSKTQPKMLVDRIEELSNTIEALEDELHSREQITKNETIDAELIKNILKKDASKLKDKSRKEMQAVIQRWINKIEVYDNELVIHFIVDNDSYSSSNLVAGVRKVIKIRISISEFLPK